MPFRVEEAPVTSPARLLIPKSQILTHHGFGGCDLIKTFFEFRSAASASQRSDATYIRLDIPVCETILVQEAKSFQKLVDDRSRIRLRQWR